MLRRILGHPDRLALIAGLLLAVIGIGANPFRGETLAPIDIVVASPAYRNLRAELQAPEQAVHGGRSDLIDSRYPWLSYIKQSVWAGDGVPRWRFTAQAPLYFNEFNLLLDPKLLLFTAVPNDGLGLYLGCLAQVFLSGLGVYLLLRRSVGALAALAGGFIYAFSGFNTAWIFDLSVQIWIPWLFWISLRYLETERRTWLVALTGVSTLLIYSVFYSVAGWSLCALGLFLIYWNATHFENWRAFLKKTLLPIAACSAAFPLAISNFLPFYDVVSHMDMSWRYSQQPLANAYLGQFFNPHHKGLHPEYAAYCGVLAVVLALATLGWARRFDREKKLLIVFYAALLGLCLALTFGWIPPAITRRLPLFSFNPWQRLFSLMGFAIAVLAAFGVSFLVGFTARLRRPALRRVLFVTLGIAAGLQAWDQIRFFRLFNAVSRNEWFYPETASIRFVKQNVLPLQTVLADESFVTGGSLGVYGLGEWFSHNSFSPVERRLLGDLVDQPFRTPFASRFPGTNIRFDSPLMQAFDVRFALIDERSVNASALDPSRFRVRDTEPGMRVVENLRAPRGAYRVSDLAAPPEAIQTEGVEVTLARADTIEMRLDDMSPGWIVAPMRNYPGWTVRDENGRAYEPQTYLGIFPAVRIDSPVRKLTWKFEPRRVLWGIRLNWILFALFAGIAYLALKKPARVNVP